MKITNADLFKIRRGLDLLNGIKSFELGMLRAKIAHIIDPEIEAMREGLKNDDFEKFRESLIGLEKDETAKIEKANRHLFEQRRKQLEEYEEHVKRPYEKNNIPTIPTSLIPDKTDTQVFELLFPILKEVEKPKTKDK